MNEEQAKSIFISAGFEVLKLYELTNQYWGKNDVVGPWWLVKTPIGFIRIGWRKRVIEIDWSDTGIRKIITESDVTKDETMVHAYTVPLAVEYLQLLCMEFNTHNAHHHKSSHISNSQLTYATYVVGSLPNYLVEELFNQYCHSCYHLKSKCACPTPITTFLESGNICVAH
jgi:hypothetical protein